MSLKTGNKSAFQGTPYGKTTLPFKEKIMKTFGTYEEVSGMKPCRKRPIMVFCKQMQEPFRVDTLEGNYKQGKAGDYLIHIGYNGN